MWHASLTWWRTVLFLTPITTRSVNRPAKSTVQGSAPRHSNHCKCVAMKGHDLFVETGDEVACCLTKDMQEIITRDRHPLYRAIGYVVYIALYSVIQKG